MSTETTYRPPTLTTEAELYENWPMGTVVQEIHTGTCCPAGDFCDFYEQIWVMVFQCGWTRAGAYYEGDDCSPRLPVRMLFNPDWEMTA